MHPHRITVERDPQTLTLDWSDGHRTVYPLDGLRRACPCATCRGHENMHELPDPEIFDVPSLMERSEERRVGKEGRSRWATYHQTKNKNTTQPEREANRATA